MMELDDGTDGTVSLPLAICAVSAFVGSYVVYVVDLDGLISVIDFIII